MCNGIDDISDVFFFLGAILCAIGVVGLIKTAAQDMRQRMRIISLRRLSRRQLLFTNRWK